MLSMARHLGFNGLGQADSDATEFVGPPAPSFPSEYATAQGPASASEYTYNSTEFVGPPASAAGQYVALPGTYGRSS